MATYTSNPVDLRKNGPMIKVRLGVPKSMTAIRPPIEVWAMVDTGCSQTIIREGLATSLGLEPVAAASLRTMHRLYKECASYLISLDFSNMTFELQVTEAPFFVQPIECLIGRDILSKGNLTYDGVNNTFTLSF
jgi:Aspartyl protease